MIGLAAGGKQGDTGEGKAMEEGCQEHLPIVWPAEVVPSSSLVISLGRTSSWNSLAVVVVAAVVVVVVVVVVV